MQTENELRLSEELASAKSEVSVIKEELRRAKQLQESFMACMSHELRTPLNSILGLTEAMTEKIYGDLNKPQLETLNGIEKGGRDLLELINNILDLTRIAGGDLAIDMGVVSIREMCESAVRSFEAKAEAGQVSLTYDDRSPSALMMGDELRIRQMVSHLIDNAIKFTPKGGSVTIDVAMDRGEETVHLAVVDTGVGIPKEAQSKLFKNFQQLDGSIRRSHSGTGLGLALVHQLAGLHGGTVSVESEEGEGSRFILSLPIGEVEGQTASTSTKEVPCKEAVVIKKALVVEDSDAAAAQLVRYLGERGIDAEVCERGDEAFGMVMRGQPDVVILDIQLPGLFGWEVMERIKAHPKTKQIPIMIVSIVDERQRAISLGASEYLVKPINRNQLGYALCKLTAAVEETPDNVTTLEETLSAPEPEEDSGRPHILLAEDNEANIKTLTDYLNAKGYRVSVARDGVEAISQTIELVPDLILMDIQMPNLNGIEAMEKMQADDSVPDVPTIALTALAMPGDRERCLAAGACDYLSKPVSLKALNAVIEKFLAKGPEAKAQIPA